MLADMMTKGLTHNKFSQLRDLTGIKNMSACEWKRARDIHSCQILSCDLFTDCTSFQMFIEYMKTFYMCCSYNTSGACKSTI